jgi:hypothetical protein
VAVVEYQGFLDPAASNGLVGEAKPVRRRAAAAAPAPEEGAAGEEPVKPTRGRVRKAAPA